MFLINRSIETIHKHETLLAAIGSHTLHARVAQTIPLYHGTFVPKAMLVLAVTGDTQSDDGTKGRSLASRLLTKKGDKRGEQLSFGGHAQSAQRRGSSLPTFDLDETSTSAYAARQQSLPTSAPLPSLSPFAPQASAEPSVEVSRQSTDDLETLQKCDPDQNHRSALTSRVSAQMLTWDYM